MSEKLDHKFAQKITLKSLEGNQAVLVLPDGQEIKWPKSLLPKELKNGQELRIIVHDKKTEEDERANLARALLNELIK